LHRRRDRNADCLNGQSHCGFDRRSICASRRIADRLCFGAATRVTLKWLGTAGWEIQFAQTKILIDSFLTRKQPVAGEEWKTDEEAALNVIGGADYIFAGHSHADHIADRPFIAKRFGARSSVPEPRSIFA
jgi:glyoxylase-like metal-dependent hydrolase (beta-lactamase superfamily II)